MNRNRSSDLYYPFGDLSSYLHNGGAQQQSGHQHFFSGLSSTGSSNSYNYYYGNNFAASKNFSCQDPNCLSCSSQYSPFVEECDSPRTKTLKNIVWCQQIQNKNNTIDNNVLNNNSGSGSSSNLSLSMEDNLNINLSIFSKGAHVRGGGEEEDFFCLQQQPSVNSNSACCQGQTQGEDSNANVNNGSIYYNQDYYYFDPTSNGNFNNNSLYSVQPFEEDRKSNLGLLINGNNATEPYNFDNNNGKDSIMALTSSSASSATTANFNKPPANLVKKRPGRKKQQLNSNNNNNGNSPLSKKERTRTKKSRASASNTVTNDESNNPVLLLETTTNNNNDNYSSSSAFSNIFKSKLNLISSTNIKDKGGNNSKITSIINGCSGDELEEDAAMMLFPTNDNGSISNSNSNMMVVDFDSMTSCTANNANNSDFVNNFYFDTSASHSTSSFNGGGHFFPFPCSTASPNTTSSSNNNSIERLSFFPVLAVNTDQLTAQQQQQAMEDNMNQSCIAFNYYPELDEQQPRHPSSLLIAEGAMEGGEFPLFPAPTSKHQNQLALGTNEEENIPLAEALTCMMKQTVTGYLNI